MVLARGLAALALVIAANAAADPCTAPLPAPGVPFSGTVRWIIDGDGLCVGNSADPSTWIELRLADFFAPELHNAGGVAARDMLASVALGRHVDCIAGRRSFDRTVARCTLAHRPIGDLMRARGVVEGGRGYWFSR